MKKEINPQRKQKPLTDRKLNKKIKKLEIAFDRTDPEDKERVESISRNLAALEAERNERQANEKMKKAVQSGILKRMKDSTKAGSVFELPDGKKAIRAEKYIKVKDHCFADPEVSTFYPSSDQLQPFVDAGDYIVILKNADEKALPIAVPVLFADIQKARGQRFKMLSFTKMNKKGVSVLQASVIKAAVEGIDESLTPEEVVLDFKDKFFESRHAETIAKDIDFMTKIMF